MIELLTVIAIVGVLATLLLAALQSAQKKSRQARCTSNLRQISLGLNMYLDDYDARPTELGAVVRKGYTPSRGVLLCPEDKSGNWGGLVNSPSSFIEPPGAVLIAEDTAAPRAGEGDAPLPFSYLHPLSWDEEAWKQLLKLGGAAGLASCQLHGLGRQNLEIPSVRDFEGLVLRAQRDAAVVRRRVHWEEPPADFTDNRTLSAGNSVSPPTGVSTYPWQLFADERPPQ